MEITGTDEERVSPDEELERFRLPTADTTKRTINRCRWIPIICLRIICMAEIELRIKMCSGAHGCCARLIISWAVSRSGLRQHLTSIVNKLARTTVRDDGWRRLKLQKYV